MAVIYLVFPLCWAAMLIRLTAVAALLPREGGRRWCVFFVFLKEVGGVLGGPGLTVCQQTQLEQKEGSPLEGPSNTVKGGRVNRDRGVWDTFQ